MVHNILNGDPSAKPRSAADSYQFPPITTLPNVTAPEVPFPPAEGSQEMFTMVLEPTEGGVCIQRDNSSPSESTPEEDAVWLPDTEETNLGSPKDSGWLKSACLSRLA
ncbi:UNVERIFIED_CONTAM: hypothetical protein K2H54_005990 [Gekko kuhli]